MVVARNDTCLVLYINMYFVYLLSFVYRSSALFITVYDNVYPTERSGKQLKNSLCHVLF